jgi:orotate phosphoribosyltransferase
MLESLVDLTALALPSVEGILKANAMEIRDVDGGEKPFLYASGFSGPGYIMIKAMVSHDFFRRLALLLAIKLAPKATGAAFVAGNVTGGVLPGWLLSQYLEQLLNREMQFCYVKGTRFRGEVEMKDDPVIVVDKKRLERMAQNLSVAAIDNLPAIDFVAGASPGGMILAFRISEILSLHTGKYVPFVYVREQRKAGGHKELITGIQGNPFFKPDMTALAVGQVRDINASTQHVVQALVESGFKTLPIHAATHDEQIAGFTREEMLEIEHPLPHRRNFKSVSQNEEALGPDSVKETCLIKLGSEGIVAEELANFAHSTCVSAQILEEDFGLHVPNAACILFYDNPKAKLDLSLEGMDMTYLLTLPQLLNAAKHFRTHSGRAIKSFRSFLVDPEGWNKKRGIERVARGGTQ